MPPYYTGIQTSDTRRMLSDLEICSIMRFEVVKRDVWTLFSAADLHGISLVIESLADTSMISSFHVSWMENIPNSLIST